MLGSGEAEKLSARILLRLCGGDGADWENSG